ncbi:tail fiber protein [Pseudoduganella ginsengisoli]|uniref:Phage tail protein n=1 Tax=Pseudoduganella ginsengisoli TaxID=1462440 RepID=A0A6L6Q8K7_9BURK|nr:tail fiber protein [Pseudoduganella ginsengisoli]MTW05528.1 phage tail protein [Pseudoduganella ginsengisoli]
MKKMIHACRLLAGVAATLGMPLAASACNTEPTIGTICTFAFDWCPRGYLPANGATLAVREYQALFALIGFRYGGNNVDQFALPDLRGRSTVGTGTGPNLVAVNIAQQVGQQAVTLSLTQTPLVPHTHNATFVGTGGGSGTQVTVPAVPSTLGVTAVLPVSPSVGAAGTTVGLASGQTGYLTAMSGKSGATSVNFSGPYTTTLPNPAASLPATVQITGSAGSPQIQFNVPNGITGGSVTVAQAGPAGAAAPVSTQSPGLGLTACIAANGLYPDRP